MTRHFDDRTLKKSLRSLSTMPPDAGFDQRLRRSLAAASREMRASKPSFTAPPMSRRTRFRLRTLLVAAALIVAAGLAARLYAARGASNSGADSPADDHAGSSSAR